MVHSSLGTSWRPVWSHLIIRSRIENSHYTFFSTNLNLMFSKSLGKVLTALVSLRVKKKTFTTQNWISKMLCIFNVTTKQDEFLSFLRSNFATRDTTPAKTIFKLITHPLSRTRLIRLYVSVQMIKLQWVSSRNFERRTSPQNNELYVLHVHKKNNTRRC